MNGGKTMEGWIRLHRKIRNSLVFNDPNLLRLWIICLLEVAHKEHKQHVGNQLVVLKPGDFLTGRFALANMYNYGLKPSEQKKPLTIWRMLERLCMLECLCIKSNNKFSVVTITNWHIYQSADAEMISIENNKRTTKEQQKITNNNDNNVKNGKNLKRNNVEYSSDFINFWELYPKRVGKMDAYKAWKQLINDGVSQELLMKCVSNYSTYCSANNVDNLYIKHPLTFLSSERFMDYENPIITKGTSNDKSRHRLERHQENRGRAGQNGWEKLVVGIPVVPMQ
jgi:hypothetical protein